MTVKVRFAPSPTGLLHVGNVRIAVLNYLFAKSNHGKFVLRIDDTDKERSKTEFEKSIIEDLKWIDIQWDEFYKQSENLAQYDKAIEHLKKIGRVYPCYETKEELSLKRKIQSSHGKPPVYDRASLYLSDEDKKNIESKGIKKYWRFKLKEDSVIEWNDLVHGKISIPLNSVSDPIVIKPDGSYVYTFASVVDDINIGITHIIRGDDHITNTAAQIDIFRAISGSNPEFAHVPLLSSIDGQEVSKRTNSSLTIINLRKNGMEPQAIVNLLATLGTSNNVNYKDNYNDLIQKFSFKKMSLSSPKFNTDDVRQLTKKIISEKSFNEIQSELEHLNLKNKAEIFWETIKGNINTINDIDFWYNIFFNPIQPCCEDKQYISQMLTALSISTDYDTWLKSLIEKTNRKGKDLFHPIRLALTAQEKGPELRKIFMLLGYDEVKNRLENNLK